MGRLWVLAIFVGINWAQGTTWSTFANLPRGAKDLFPSLGDEDLAWQMNCNSIFQGLTAPIAVWLLLQKSGLKYTVWAGAGLLVIQCGLFGAAAALPADFRKSLIADIILFVGSAAGGVASAFVQGAPSYLSALWFPKELRARVTATAYIGAYIGQSTGYLLTMLINSADTGKGLQMLLYAETAFVFVLCVPAVWCFPDDPLTCNPRTAQTEAHDARSPESSAVGSVHVAEPRKHEQVAEALLPPTHDPHTQEATMSSIASSLRVCAGNRSCTLLLISGGALNGAYLGYQACLPMVLDKLDGFSDHDGDMFAFTSGLTYCIGADFPCLPTI